MTIPHRLGLASAAFALLLGYPMPAAADDTLRAQLFGADLTPARAWTAPAGGAVVALETLPDGGMAALVRSGSGPASLARWSGEGKAAGRVQVEALRGAIEGARRRADGGWVVLTEAEVTLVGAGGQVLQRRAREAASEKPEVAAVGEDGAWLAWPDRLVSLPLAGPPATVKLPIQEPPLETCRKEYDRLEDCKWEIGTAGLTPLAGGGCLVNEALVTYHNASGFNRTEQAALAAVDGSGRVVARALVGEIESRLEWFNFGSSSGNLTGAPGKFSLVRRAYQGSTGVWRAAARGEEILIVVRSGAASSLKRLDTRLRVRWSRDVTTVGATAISPSWTKGILVFSGFATLESFGDDGRPAIDSTVPPGDLDPSKLRNAIGQTPAGEWLLVSY